MPVGTKDRILRAALRLFGELGFEGTTIAAIEKAAGLSPGSGAVYRHFAAKDDILRAGVRAQIAANQALIDALDPPPPPEHQEPAKQPDPASLRQDLLATATAGLRRLDAEQDLNRLLLRDLRHHPDLLREVSEHDLAPVRTALTAYLRTRGATGDVEALAAVLAGAVSHYWIFRDVFGGHPSGVSFDRYAALLADLVATWIADTAPHAD